MDTSGYKGWLPMKFFEGKDVLGNVQTSEGYKNAVNGEEFIPERGHNADPPYPTGELTMIRHSSDAYNRGWERIWGKGNHQDQGGVDACR